MKYFINFIEECVQNPLYKDYIGGRIEVYEQTVTDGPYSCNEIRFFTKDVKKFRAFRNRWDMKDITGRQLKWIEKKVEREFCQFPKK